MASKRAWKGYHMIDGVLVCDNFSHSPAEYHIGEHASARGELLLCDNGIHVCTEPLDCWQFYEPCDLNTVIGNVITEGMTQETDGWSTKRVVRDIFVVNALNENDEYDKLVEEVSNLARNKWDGPACGQEVANAGTSTICFLDHAYAYDKGWSIGDADSVLMMAGPYSYAHTDSCFISIAITYSRCSVAESFHAIACGTNSLARTTRDSGVALTIKCSSVAVAEHTWSVAVAGNSFSRAACNGRFSVAVTMETTSTVVLNKEGSVGVSTGDAFVLAKGCTLVLLPGKINGSAEEIDSYYYGSGDVMGVDGTCVTVFDRNAMKWRSIHLRKGDKNYPADTRMSIQCLVERVIKEYEHETDS